MKKNPNKKAGEWGALNNKPINQIYFKDGGSVKKNKSTKKYTLGNPAKSLAKVGAIKKVKLASKKKLISKSWLK